MLHDEFAGACSHTKEVESSPSPEPRKLELMTRAYEEIVDFLSQGTTPEAVAAFEASTEAKQRVAELVSKEKLDELPPDEAAELNHFIEIEHLMRLVKARALQHVSP